MQDSFKDFTQTIQKTDGSQIFHFICRLARFWDRYHMSCFPRSREFPRGQYLVNQLCEEFVRFFKTMFGIESGPVDFLFLSFPKMEQISSALVKSVSDRGVAV